MNRYKLEQTVPTNSFVSEWIQADLSDIFDTMCILLSSLGYRLFDEMRSLKETSNHIEQTVNLFYCKGKSVEARGERTEEGFVVYKDSQMSKTHGNSVTHGVLAVVKKMIAEKIVVEQGHTYIFVEDYLFSSPSQASTIVLRKKLERMD